MTNPGDHTMPSIRVSFPNTQEGRREASLLYLVLVANARPWNNRVRTELRQVLTDTEIYNADISQHGKSIRSAAASD